MFKFLNLQLEVFGIDINDSSLKLVKLKKNRKGFKIVSFNEVKLDAGIVKEGVILNEEALVKIISLACKTVKGKKLDTKYVIASLPEEKSFSQVIQMPRMTENELKSAVPFEAENYIPLTIDKVYLDFQVMDSGENHNSHSDLLINVMPKSIVDSYVSCFKKAGLVPCILEVESQAVVRSLLQNGRSNSSFIFIDFGYNSTSFIIFSGNSIRFTCSIPISSDQLTSAISSSLGVSLPKAEELKIKYGLALQSQKKYDIEKAVTPILSDLVLQIKKYINFYYGHVSHEYFSSDAKIEKIILCGGGANLKGMPDFFSKTLSMKVELGNPLINIIPQKKNDSNIISKETALSFTTVLGLALRGANSE